MAGGEGGGAQAITKSSRLHRPPINIQQSTNDGDHGGWEMEGCAREVRGLDEDGKGGEECDNGRHNNDNNAMTMNNKDAALPLPLQLPSPLPLQSPTPWTSPSPLPLHLPLPSPLPLP
jgi:hypothetical protein